MPSVPRSSASSFSSPPIASAGSATRAPTTRGSDGNLSTAAVSPDTHDRHSNSWGLPVAPDLAAGLNRYRISIRQQPIAARACGQGERDRRTIDPPPILQLTLVDYDPESPDDQARLRWPMNIVHCALHSVPTRPTETGAASRDVSTIPDPNNTDRQSRRLMGTLVANPFIGNDPEVPASAKESERLGCFFVFHDLSCRQNGLYRLRFTLVSVNVDSLVTGGRMPTMATIDSDIFEVFSAKDFPGMRASSLLTRSLKSQGANVQVKKGSEGKASQAKRRGASPSEESASNGSGREESSPKSKKRRRK
ncbi:hypothetical protein MMC19_007689 [Ptychographa xylographoides]|nr:hypothetical protein [Ptychographa xylographoides]